MWNQLCPQEGSRKRLFTCIMCRCCYFISHLSAFCCIFQSSYLPNSMRLGSFRSWKSLPAMLTACFFTILGVILRDFFWFCFRFILLLLLCQYGISFFFFAWPVVIVNGVGYFFVALGQSFLTFCFVLLQVCSFFLLCRDGNSFFSLLGMLLLCLVLFIFS